MYVVLACIDAARRLMSVLLHAAMSNEHLLRCRQLSKERLNHWLESDHNDISNPAMTEQVYQNMDYPLSMYPSPLPPSRRPRPHTGH